MKINILKFLFIIGLFLSGNLIFAQTVLPTDDKEKIIIALDKLVLAINSNDMQGIVALVSPDNPTLQTEIQNYVRKAGVIGSIESGITYQLDYGNFDDNIEILSQNKVKIKLKFASAGLGWSISGLSNYFIFEKENNNQWLISDTDFHKKLGQDYVIGMIKKVLIIAGPIMAFLFAFWLWMLIDCIKRDFDDKALWIILFIFLNSIAAILYFFIVKRKNTTRKPLEFKM